MLGPGGPSQKQVLSQHILQRDAISCFQGNMLMVNTVKKILRWCWERAVVRDMEKVREWGSSQPALWVGVLASETDLQLGPVPLTTLSPGVLPIRGPHYTLLLQWV